MRAAIAVYLILAACHSEENLGNTPTRMILASSSGNSPVNNLALDADYLYWTITDSFPAECPPGQCFDMARIPRGGGAVEQLAQIPVASGGTFVIDDTYISTSVTPATQQASALIRIPKTGGGVQILDDTAGSDSPVAADDDFVYAWYDDGTVSVLRAYPASGAAPTVIVDPFQAQSGVIAHDKLLYYVDGVGALVSVPRIGGSPTEIGLGFNHYLQLVATNDSLYILQVPPSDGTLVSCGSQITAMSFADGTLQPLVTGSCATSVAVSANTIFAVQEDTKIIAYNLDGSGERDILTEQYVPDSLVADPTEASLFYYSRGEIIALDFN
jgi:hypothetical protein